MLNYAALSIVFMIVCIAVPHMAAGIAGGTVGLALSHAFEAAYVAQTIIRPITSALQTGFNKVAQIGSGSAGNSGEPAGWAKAMDFGRQTQQLGNLGPDGGQRVPAPKDVRGTSVMPSRAPNTTAINPGTARYGNGNSGTTTMSKATSKIWAEDFSASSATGSSIDERLNYKVGYLQAAQRDGLRAVRNWRSPPERTDVALQGLAHRADRRRSWLAKAENANGAHAFVRPHGTHALSLVDDLGVDAIARMTAAGYQLALVVQTSPQNFQAELKHKRTPDHNVSTLAANELATRLGGDLSSADCRHFGEIKLLFGLIQGQVLRFWSACWLDRGPGGEMAYAEDLKFSGG
jgi:hypothetical protein